MVSSRGWSTDSPGRGFLIMRNLVDYARKSHSGSTAGFSLIVAGIAALCLFAGSAHADSCTADLTGELRKSQERGDTMEHSFALMVRSSVDCAMVKYKLEINQRTAAGETEVKIIRNFIKVRSGPDRTRLVSHRTPKDTKIISYQFSIVACDICGT